MARILCLFFTLVSGQTGWTALENAGLQDPVPQYKWRSKVSATGAPLSFGDPSLFMQESPGGGQEEHLVVFASDPVANETFLNVFRTDSGEVLWTRPMLKGVPWPSFSGWVAIGPTAPASSVLALFAGTQTGVVALAAADGALLWEHKAAAIPPPTPGQPAVPVHPTYGLGWIAYTFENGVNSSELAVLRASDGQQVDIDDLKGQLAFTKVWFSSSHSAIVYGQYSPSSGSIAIVARRLGDSQLGALLWSMDGLSYSPPGLWDNPNLDVDESNGGPTIYLYHEPNVSYREVHALDGHTGREIWRHDQFHDFADYDTFAFGGRFFGLTTKTPQTMSVYSLNGQSGQLLHEGDLNCSDANAILLVGGQTSAEDVIYVFGLSSNQVYALSSSGTLLWHLTDLDQPTSGVVSPVDGTLYFGTAGDGVFRAVAQATRKDMNEVLHI